MFIAGSKTVSFEFNRKITTGRQIIHPVEEISQEQLFMKGIDWMPTISYESFEKTIAIHSLKILININTSNYLLARRYPIGSFAAVINSLYAWNNRLQFYLTGTPDEVSYVNMLVEKLPGLPLHNVCGKWTIEKLWNELSDCALLITGDSGPLHMAAYIGTPTVAIWGPTQPEHFGYTDESHVHHVSLKMSCSPCFKHPASHPAYACHGKIDCLKIMPESIVSRRAIHILSSQVPLRKIHIPVTVASNMNSQLQSTAI